MVRTLIKIAVGILLVLVVALFLALARVDYTPYFEADYYRSTQARLDSVTSELAPPTGEVRVGWARESITPLLNASEDNPVEGAFKAVPLAGYGNRDGKPAEGIHDSVFVKAVALEVQDQLLVLVASDLLIVPPEVSAGGSKNLEQQIGLERSQLFFSATHTHSSVGAWSEGMVGEAFAGEFNAGIVQWLVERFSQAVIKSVENLQPGQLGVGSFNAADFVANRLVGEKGTKNPEFIFLVAQQHSGRKAILGSFDAHATTLSDDNMLFSGDYPGYWQRKLEYAGADMAVFFAGSVGSHRPVSSGEKFDKPKFIGEALADSVLKYERTISLRDSITLASVNLEMDLPEFHVRVSDGIRLVPAISQNLFPPIGKVYLQAARIGNLIWATTPGDFSGETAIILKNAMHKKGYKALVTSFNGTYTGYIIPGKYYHLNEYESRVMSWFGPYMGPYTNDMLEQLMQAVSSPVLTPVRIPQPEYLDALGSM
jgi:hypothetical protein